MNTPIKRLLAAAVIIAGGVAVGSASAQAQDPGTGASANKNCPGITVQPGQTITCTFTVANIGDFPATVTALTETSPFPGGTPVAETCTTAAGQVVAAGSTLAPDTPCSGTFTSTIPNDPALCGTIIVDRVSIELAYGAQFPEPLVAGAFATELTLVVCPPPGDGGEGCTPGFWKQPQHAEEWTGFTPTQSFDTVFGVDVTLSGGTTLLDALNSGGGGINALARHAVAALLNASNPDVDFSLTAAEVIAIVQDGVAPGGLTIEEAKNLLAAANEAGCPLN